MEALHSTLTSIFGYVRQSSSSARSNGQSYLPSQRPVIEMQVKSPHVNLPRGQKNLAFGVVLTDHY